MHAAARQFSDHLNRVLNRTITEHQLVALQSPATATRTFEQVTLRFGTSTGAGVRAATTLHSVPGTEQLYDERIAAHATFARLVEVPSPRDDAEWQAAREASRVAIIRFTDVLRHVVVNGRG